VEHAQYIEPICAFLTQIGIRWEWGTIPGDTFLPGLLIDQGKLTIDKERLKFPGDILHEAGHIALTSPDIRHELGQSHLNETAAQGSEELGVLLWSWLAAQQLGVPERVLFHEHGYKGEADWLISQFGSGNYIGLPLLKWMGIVKRDEGNGTTSDQIEIENWLRQQPLMV
jgi:hypothetical protein